MLVMKPRKRTGKDAEHPFEASMDYQGITIDIEHKPGSTRSGVDDDGRPWSIKMPGFYGEVRGTVGADGDAIDVMLPPDPDPFGTHAYVIHAKLPGKKTFDEDKVVLGCRTRTEAIALFRSMYGRSGFYKGCTRWPMAAWKEAINRKPKQKGPMRMVLRKGTEQLRGGRGDGRPDRDFDADDLAEGVRHEMEHTTDRDVAEEIAKDHLSEDPDYYRKLRKLEKAARDPLFALLHLTKAQQLSLFGGPRRPAPAAPTAPSGEKANVKQHIRKTKSGKAALVMQHQRKKKPKKAEPPPEPEEVAPEPEPEPEPERATEHVPLGVVPGSRRSKWKPRMGIHAHLMGDIEETGSARKHVTKAKVFGSYSHEEAKANGMTAGGSYLLQQLMKAVAGKPADTPEARLTYVEAATRLQKLANACRTAADVELLARALQAETHGRLNDPATTGLDVDQLWQTLGVDPTTHDFSQYPSGGGWRQVPVPDPGGVLAGAYQVASTAYRQAMRDHATAVHDDAEPEKIEMLATLKAERRRQLRKLQDSMVVQVSNGFLASRGYSDLGSSRDAVAGNSLQSTKWTLFKKNEDKGAHAVFVRHAMALGGTDPELAGAARAMSKSQWGKLMGVYVGSNIGTFWRKHVDLAKRKDRAGDEGWVGLVKDPNAKGSDRLRGERWRRPVVGQKRVGGPEVDTSNVSTHTLANEFGIQRVDFGNYVNQASRDYHLARTVESLTDLADVLGIDPKQLSNGRKLSIGFGSHGDPKNKFINITHTNGDGTLAHEWSHFLDHMLGDPDKHDEARTHNASAKIAMGKPLGWGDELEGAFIDATIAINHRPESGERVREAIKVARAQLVKAKRGDNDYAVKRAEARYRAAVMRAANPGRREMSEFRRNADGLAGGRALTKSFGSQQHYWHSPHEMFARCFESYMEDELRSQGRMNTYLVYGTQGRQPVARVVNNELVGFEPYPQDDERKRITDAIKAFTGVVARTKALQKAIAARLNPRGTR
jgi:hypothetical protein